MKELTFICQSEQSLRSDYFERAEFESKTEQFWGESVKIRWQLIYKVLYKFY